MKKTITLLFCLVLMTSCDVAKQATGMFNMTQCKYTYGSISGLTLAGIDLQNAKSLSSLNPLNAASLLGAFSSSNGSLPLSFTLNLNVANNSTQAAFFNGLAYILEVDGKQLTQGNLTQAFNVAGGNSAVLPITMAFDLKSALSGESLEAIKNLAFNFAGIGTESSQVTFRLKPNFLIGSQTVAAPQYIPVSFTLNK
ncbi:LEA type 2 family protein [Bacteroidales bacterium OttesenSCG-928-J19]|nr:LEA type 2 family protein [Bacteroidales bacterium OttesenSCG-928-J19]